VACDSNHAFKWVEGGRKRRHTYLLSDRREVLSAARNRGIELHVLNAGNESDFDAVFADIKRLRAGGLVITVSAPRPAKQSQRGHATLRQL
jgi:hypothetical protein